MLSDLDIRTTLGEVLGLEDMNLITNRERDLSNIYRSGSAPPTVQGSLNALGGLSEEDIRSHPAYISYYYSHDNLNPRLPPPLLSKEDWRAAQRRQELLDYDGNNKSLFSLQPPGVPMQNGATNLNLIEPRKVAAKNLSRQPSAEWIEKDTDGLIGLASVGLGARRKSLADMLQEGLGRPTFKSGHLSRPSSCNAFEDPRESMSISDPQSRHLHSRADSLDAVHSVATTPGMVRVQSLGSCISQSFASVVGSSLSRSTTPEATLVGRSPACSLPPLGGRVSVPDKRSAVSSVVGDCRNLSDSLSALTLSKSRLLEENDHVRSQMEPFLKQPSSFDMPHGHSHGLQHQHQHLIDSSRSEMPTVSTIYEKLAKTNGTDTDLRTSKMNIDMQVDLPPRETSANSYTKVPSSGSLSLEGSGFHHQNVNVENMNSSGYNPSGNNVNHRFSPSMRDHSDAGGQAFRSRSHVGPSLQVPVDPLYVQYLQRDSDSTSQLSDPFLGRNYIGAQADFITFQKAYLAALLAQQKQHYNASFLDRSNGLYPGYFGSPTFGMGLPYPGSAMGSCMHPSVGYGNEQIADYPSVLRSSMGSWPPYNIGTSGDGFTSLLEEFKNSKTRCFELAEIVDHVVEFSADQYGSRFIQQKLETASIEEKKMIFPEIMPHARTLMTDVFGNYVIQKFFEHGTESQRKELSSQLKGHVLPLSIQMYGCRVIQKALEVVDIDKQREIVAELEGSIMKCVRDQNGNHVIQKCIECVPQDEIQFIISSFYGQVVALSTHPYGCRVIQRVLEHCKDEKTQGIVMEEIMQSICSLAQDQYGNYVVQHVLQHGKPQERWSIISKLSGQIVKMSQQKFASNVVEKCLTFGSPSERQLLVDEMLGSSDENEALQVMMKDQYGNYVVQKVIEICDDESRELILSRVKVHLNALKKYTYGKHIVARVEKLITTGERRMGLAMTSSSP